MEQKQVKNQIIENLEKELKEATSKAKIKEIKENLSFQKGFRHGITIALSDLNYKITRKNKYLLNY